MKVGDLFVAGLGSYLPRPVNVNAAVAEGHYDAHEAAETDLESVLVADDEAPPDMAVEAGRRALAGAAVAPDEIDLVLHASICFQVLEFFPTASYIQRAVAGERPAVALEVKGLSNGGMAAIELAASYLRADASRRAALITTADKFCRPWINR